MSVYKLLSPSTSLILLCNASVKGSLCAAEGRSGGLSEKKSLHSMQPTPRDADLLHYRKELPESLLQQTESLNLTGNVDLPQDEGSSWEASELIPAAYPQETKPHLDEPPPVDGFGLATGTLFHAGIPRLRLPPLQSRSLVDKALFPVVSGNY